MQHFEAMPFWAIFNPRLTICQRRIIGLLLRGKRQRQETMARWCHTTRVHIREQLRGLVALGLVVRETEIVRGCIRRTAYKLVGRLRYCIRPFQSENKKMKPEAIGGKEHVPHWVLFNPELTETDIQVWCLIHRCTTRKLRKATETMARWCHKSVRTIKYATKHLGELGLIEKSGRQWRLTAKVLDWKPAEKKRREPRVAPTTRTQSCTGTRTQSCTPVQTSCEEQNRLAVGTPPLPQAEGRGTSFARQERTDRPQQPADTESPTWKLLRRLKQETGLEWGTLAPEFQECCLIEILTFARESDFLKAATGRDLVRACCHSNWQGMDLSLGIRLSRKYRQRFFNVLLDVIDQRQQEEIRKEQASRKRVIISNGDYQKVMVEDDELPEGWRVIGDT